jgi:PleD family two-component response regulator
MSPESHLPPIGLSFGIAERQTGETIDDTLRRADQALYAAKRDGRSPAVASVAGAIEHDGDGLPA